MALSKNSEYLPYLYTCNRCRSCTTTKNGIPICPSYSKLGYFAYSGGGKLYLAQGVIEKKIPVDKDLAEVAYYCHLCGGCKEMCPPGFETISIIRDIRELILKRGIDFNGHKKIIDSIDQYENPWGLQKDDKARGLINSKINEAPQAKVHGFRPDTSGLHVELNPDNASIRPDVVGAVLSRRDKTNAPGKILLYLGCLVSYNPELKEIFHAIVNIFDKAGIDVILLGRDEPCCGRYALELGDKGFFVKKAHENIKFFNNLEIDTIITPCPHCLSTLKNDYFEIGELIPGIKHITEFISDLLEAKRINLKNSISTIATYHDPCHIGRYCGIYDTPRNIISLMPAIKLIEMRRKRNEAFCCGGGSYVKDIYPDFYEYTLGQRMEEAKETGAEMLITSCPFCKLSFNDGVKKGNEKFIIKDIAEIVSEALGE